MLALRRMRVAIVDNMMWWVWAVVVAMAMDVSPVDSYLSSVERDVSSVDSDVSPVDSDSKKFDERWMLIC